MPWILVAKDPHTVEFRELRAGDVFVHPGQHDRWLLKAKDYPGGWEYCTIEIGNRRGP